METYRRFWIESADRLEEHLKTMKAKKREQHESQKAENHEGKKQKEVKKHDK
jgi:hypothetical protein